jgi:Leucine rich repeat
MGAHAMSVAVLLLGFQAPDVDTDPPSLAAAIAELKALGGTVVLEPNGSGNPVAVYLPGRGEALAKGLRLVQGFHHLTTLDLQSAKVTDDHLAQLKGLTSLRELHLGGNTFSCKGIGQLRDLANLQSLHVGATRFDDEGFAGSRPSRHFRATASPRAKLVELGVRPPPDQTAGRLGLPLTGGVGEGRLEPERLHQPEEKGSGVFSDREGPKRLPTLFSSREGCSSPTPANGE